MSARFRKFIADLSDKFWLIPAVMVMPGIVLAILFVNIDRSGIISQKIIDGPWLYSGGGTGARTLLGAVVSSTIGVAGTVFSITIAALSLAAGQMGPRLLRNFTHDRGNQITLGVFLGTFSYALDGTSQRPNPKRRRIRSAFLAQRQYFSRVCLRWHACLLRRTIRALFASSG